MPYYCLDVEVSTPTARGGQTLVRLKMRNLLTRAVFDKTFKASDKFKEPDLETVEASYLYSDGDGSYFLDQTSFETLTLSADKLGDALDFLVEGMIIQLDKYNGNPIAIQLPAQVELKVEYTEPAVRGDTSSGGVTKPAKLETGLEIKVPFFIKTGEAVKVNTETREFAGGHNGRLTVPSRRNKHIGAERSRLCPTVCQKNLSSRICMPKPESITTRTWREWALTHLETPCPLPPR